MPDSGPGPFAGQVALVTGAAQGIGEGIAAHLASEGAAVGLIDIDEPGGRAAEARLRQRGLAADFWLCDLSRPDAITECVRAVWQQAGRIDVLVNNAAAHGRRLPLLEYSVADWEAVIRTNLTGTFWLTREVARLMVAAGIAGAIVNVLAIQSQVPLPRYGPYVASKGGLEALTKVMAVELAPLGIRANAVMLGAILSGSTRHLLQQDPNDAIDFESVAAAIDQAAPTLVRRLGRPSDVARAVAFLAERESSYMTGATLVVDGGRLLNRGADAFSAAGERD